VKCVILSFYEHLFLLHKVLLEEFYQTFHASFFSPFSKGFFNIIVRLVDHFDHLPVDAPDAASGVCGLRDGVGLNVSFSSGVVFVWFVFPTHFFWRHASGLAVFSGLGGTFRPECDGLGRLGFGVQQL